MLRKHSPEKEEKKNLEARKENEKILLDFCANNRHKLLNSLWLTLQKQYKKDPDRTRAEQRHIKSIDEFTNHNNETCLHIAINNNSDELITTLLDLGANPLHVYPKSKKSLIELAFESAKIAAVCVSVFNDNRLLNKNLATILAIILHKNFDRNEYLSQAAILACKANNIYSLEKIIQIAKQKKTSIHNSSNKEGNYCLHIAVQNASSAMLALLLNDDAIKIHQPRCHPSDNQTPFEAAMKNENLELIYTILSHNNFLKIREKNSLLNDIAYAIFLARKKMNNGFEEQFFSLAKKQNLELALLGERIPLFQQDEVLKKENNGNFEFMPKRPDSQGYRSRLTSILNLPEEIFAAIVDFLSIKSIYSFWNTSHSIRALTGYIQDKFKNVFMPQQFPKTKIELAKQSLEKKNAKKKKNEEIKAVQFSDIYKYLSLKSNHFFDDARLNKIKHCICTGQTLEMIKQSYTFHDLIKTDSEGYTLVDWAVNFGNRKLLNDFYELGNVYLLHARNKSITDIDAAIFYWQIKCMQYQNGENLDTLPIKIDGLPIAFILAIRNNDQKLIEKLISLFLQSIKEEQKSEKLAKIFVSSCSDLFYYGGFLKLTPSHVSTPIEALVFHKNRAICEIFFSYTPPTREILKLAIVDGDLDFVKYLWEKVSDKNNLTIELNYAIQCNRLKIIKFLIKKGTNAQSCNLGLLNFKYPQQATVTLKYLIDQNADLNGYDRNYNTALFNAILAQNEEAVRLLLTKKPEIFLPSDNALDISALDSAIQAYNDSLKTNSMTKILIAKNIVLLVIPNALEQKHKINIFQAEKVLRWSLTQGDNELIKELLKIPLANTISFFHAHQKNAIPISFSHEKEHQRNALLWALEHDLIWAENILKADQTSANLIINNNNDTLLHLAIQKNWSDATNLLLKYGADKHALNFANQTPNHLCLESKNVFANKPVAQSPNVDSKEEISALLQSLNQLNRINIVASEVKTYPELKEYIAQIDKGMAENKKISGFNFRIFTSDYSAECISKAGKALLNFLKTKNKTEKMQRELAKHLAVLTNTNLYQFYKEFVDEAMQKSIAMLATTTTTRTHGRFEYKCF